MVVVGKLIQLKPFVIAYRFLNIFVLIFISLESDTDVTKTQKETKLPYAIFQIGNGSPINLLKFIETIEQTMGKKAEKVFMPMQEGDVRRTWAGVESIAKFTEHRPETDITVGVGGFVVCFKCFDNLPLLINN